ncbi:MAG: hypothetical protein OEQ13_08705, partial [Acidobacteriota bacterium]|nr:hypothetical protein [Acidobacteriota bacterium]
AAGGRVNPLFVDKVGSSVKLDWGASCSTADNAYGVYEGVMGGTFNSHTTIGQCGLAVTTATFSPGSGNRYYLVVPEDGANEGSYGVNSGGAERVVGGSQCRTQTLGTCP